MIFAIAVIGITSLFVFLPDDRVNFFDKEYKQIKIGMSQDDIIYDVTKLGDENHNRKNYPGGYSQTYADYDKQGVLNCLVVRYNNKDTVIAKEKYRLTLRRKVQTWLGLVTNQ